MKIHNPQAIVTWVLKNEFPNEFEAMVEAAKLPGAKVYFADNEGWIICEFPGWNGKHTYKVEVPETRTREMRAEEYMGWLLREKVNEFESDYGDDHYVYSNVMKWSQEGLVLGSHLVANYGEGGLFRSATWDYAKKYIECYKDGKWQKMEVVEDERI